LKGAVEMFMPFVKSSSRQRINQDLAGAVGSGEETTVGVSLGGRHDRRRYRRGFEPPGSQTG